MALGARPFNVIAMIVGRVMIDTLIGAAAGLAAAVAMIRFLSSLLYGVTATDPITFAGLTLLLVSIAFIASCLPSIKAAKVDPMEAPRYE